MQPMNKKIKAKWLDALRNQNYSQTQGVLRDDKGFCCLGVLCDILEPEKWEVIGNGWDIFGEDGVLPKAIELKLGLHTDNPSFIPTEELVHKLVKDDKLTGKWQKIIEKNGAIPLSVLNDAGYTFLEIADFIEEYL